MQLILGMAPPVLSCETAKRSSLPHWKNVGGLRIALHGGALSSDVSGHMSKSRYSPIRPCLYTHGCHWQA